MLLDEPVEHLDADQASRLLISVLSKLEDRLVIYSTHGRDNAPAVVQISLGTKQEK